MIFLPLLKQHVSHSQKAYLIVLFMPIKTTEAKYRYNVTISFLEWPLILSFFFFSYMHILARGWIFMYAAVEICRYLHHFKRDRKKKERRRGGRVLQRYSNTGSLWNATAFVSVALGAADEQVSVGGEIVTDGSRMTDVSGRYWGDSSTSTTACPTPSPENDPGSCFHTSLPFYNSYRYHVSRGLNL